MIEIITMFSEIDDFCLEFEPEYNKRLLKAGKKKETSQVG